jgi:hypothetical protein
MGILDVSEAVPAKYPLINDDITSIDMNFAYSNEGFNFNHPVLKGHDLNTGEFIPSKGIEYSTFTPKFTEIKK